MIAVDTNVVLRLLVADDHDQAAKARRLFDEQAAADGESIWLADIVLAEVVRALDRVYGRARTEIAAALRVLASHATVSLESRTAVVESIALYERGPAQFVDYLLAVKAREAGCTGLRTFDRRMRALPGVQNL